MKYCKLLPGQTSAESWLQQEVSCDKIKKKIVYHKIKLALGYLAL